MLTAEQNMLLQFIQSNQTQQSWNTYENQKYVTHHLLKLHEGEITTIFYGFAREKEVVYQNYHKMGPLFIYRKYDQKVIVLDTYNYKNICNFTNTNYVPQTIDGIEFTTFHLLAEKANDAITKRIQRIFDGVQLHEKDKYIRPRVPTEEEVLRWSKDIYGFHLSPSSVSLAKADSWSNFSADMIEKDFFEHIPLAVSIQRYMDKQNDSIIRAITNFEFLANSKNPVQDDIRALYDALEEPKYVTITLVNKLGVSASGKYEAKSLRRNILEQRELSHWGFQTSIQGKEVEQILAPDNKKYCELTLDMLQSVSYKNKLLYFKEIYNETTKNN